MTDGFFGNKDFFLVVGIFAGLFVLVTLAYLFADNRLGGFSKELEGFYCTPHDGSCAGGVRVTLEGLFGTIPSDGCEKTPKGECSGTCYWCDPSSDTGRHCLNNTEYSGYCVIDIPNKPMSCGKRIAHRCVENGGYGIEGCCPEKGKNIEPEDDKDPEIKCDNIATCDSTDE